MKRKKTAVEPPVIPINTISKAVEGDKAAIEEIIKAYEPYIIFQSTYTVENDDGTTKEMFDEDLAQELRMTMVEAIPKFDPFKEG